MVILGTDIKLNIHVEPIDGLSMSEYDFECTFYVFPNRKVSISKNKMKKVDSNNYIALISSLDAYTIGKGKIIMEMTAYIPDNDFDDYIRTEKVKLWTGITIV